MSAVEAAPFGLIPGDTSDSDEVESTSDLAVSSPRRYDAGSTANGAPRHNGNSTNSQSQKQTMTLPLAQTRRIHSTNTHSNNRGSHVQFATVSEKHRGGNTTPTYAAGLGPAGSTLNSDDQIRSATSSHKETPPTCDDTPEQGGQTHGGDRRSTSGSSSPLPEAVAAAAEEEEDPATAADSNTILIFDWDDTLFPSTWLSLQDLTLDENCRIPPNKARILNEMAECSKRLLKVATSLGTVVIVTNAEEGWIDLSCKKFLPSLYDYLSQFKQLSARTKYEKQISNCPFTWKQMAFRDEIYAHFQKKATPQRAGGRDHNFCVVSLGDSAHERLAVISITQLLPFNRKKNCSAKPFASGLDSHHRDVIGGNHGWGTCRTKSIKFIERPGIDELMQEHGLIMNLLEGVVKHNDDMDLYIRSSNPILTGAVAAGTATTTTTSSSNGSSSGGSGPPGSCLPPLPAAAAAATCGWTKQQQPQPRAPAIPFDNSIANHRTMMTRHRTRTVTAAPPTTTTASMVGRIRS